MALQNLSRPSKDIYLVYIMSGSKVGFRIKTYFQQATKTPPPGSQKPRCGLSAEDFYFVICTVYLKTC